MLVRAFLLSYIKYGDHDAVLHCFCKESGFESFFLKGIYSSRNKKKAYLFPLNEVQLHVSEKGKNLKKALKIEQVRPCQFITDIKVNSVLFFCAELLHHLLRNEQQNDKIYHEIELFLEELFRENYQSHLILMLRILMHQGLQPLYSEQAYLNPDSGTFQDQEVHHLYDKEVSDIWKNLLRAEHPYQIKLTRYQKQRFLESLLVYYQYHYTEFRIPKSLEIIQEIF